MIRNSTRIRGEAPVTIIHADELRPGDVVEYLGERHLVSRVNRPHGGAWSVACDDAGWAMALGHELVAVMRAA